uniref:Uncharacterized protein n=1 Tax=Pararge aegeria TaxID=116150 RepID=S4PJA7_9NEOP
MRASKIVMSQKNGISVDAARQINCKVCALHSLRENDKQSLQSQVAVNQIAIYNVNASNTLGTCRSGRIPET